jgi:anthraniloyl-CoA monooxygenase
MRITVIGGGPAGLYFSILMKKSAPDTEIEVLERNRADDTFGFGVVFSDAALENVERTDPETYSAITDHFAHWDDIEIHYRGHKLRSTGHGFSGLSRKTLLEILQRRASALGVKQKNSVEVADLSSAESSDLVLAADGANSFVRAKLSEHFRPSIDWRPNRFVWLGTTFPFPAFTFYFRENEHGLWRVHAYRYEKDRSTFIVEATEKVWRSAGLENASEDDTIAFCERLFKEELQGHALLKNRSLWRSFPIIRCAQWHHRNIVLAGDAAHTAHFSIGSGTKLAMEDAIVLRDALLAKRDIPAALAEYQRVRLPQVESFQRAAQVSLQWFEDTERYMGYEPIHFGFSLLTRSLRVTHENLKLRDPEYGRSIDRWFAEKAAAQSGARINMDSPPPPLFTPFRLREMLLENRVAVSPMCMYSAEDGLVDDFHLVHLGSRALGGAGLLFTEMTDVSREGRISPGCAGMYSDEHVAGWRRIVEFAHRNSWAKIAMQLGHAGRKGSTRLAWDGMDEPLERGGWEVMSASPIPWFRHSPVPREMTRQDMDNVIAQFVAATKRCEQAGFDMVELHYAHGYLLSSFISPLTNVRKDEYGGSLENRMRFPLELMREVRKAWPSAKPVSVRISATDWSPGGLEPGDAVEVARMLKGAGADVIDVSAGQTVPFAKPVYGRQFQTPLSERVRVEAQVPTMAVGNITSYADVNTILAAGRADICVLARAHLYDPYWTRHAAQELGFRMKWPKQYESLDRFTPRFK